MYLTFNEYMDMGGKVAESDFNRFMVRANATISRMTHGRVLNESPVRTSVKYAAYELVNAMYADAQMGADGREIASMSNDGMSVSFAVGGQSGASSAAQRYAFIVRSYLEYEVDANGTMLLYAGVDA
jgi:hypothetical protein